MNLIHFQVTSHRLLKETLALSDVLRPLTFLNALKQQTARAAGVAVDALRLECTWDKSVPRGAALSVIISGLFVQGGSFNGSQLQEVASDSPSITALPSATIGFVSDTAGVENPAAVSVPVYETSTREKYVFLYAHMHFPAFSLSFFLQFLD
jgi:dynein heavy chain 2